MIGCVYSAQLGNPSCLNMLTLSVLGWLDSSPETSDYAEICKLQTELCTSCSVQCNLQICCDFTWSFFYCGRRLGCNAVLADIPVHLNTGII